MKRDKTDISTTLVPPLSLFRGLYNRVALRLGVDPSYVSRVARGQRNSESVRQALEEEMKTIREHLNNHNGNHASNHNGNHPNNHNGNHASNRNGNAPEGRPASRRLAGRK